MKLDVFVDCHNDYIFLLTEGQLRHKETEQPFEFNVREGDHYYNQKHYNALGEVCHKIKTYDRCIYCW